MLKKVLACVAGLVGLSYSPVFAGGSCLAQNAAAGLIALRSHSEGRRISRHKQSTAPTANRQLPTPVFAQSRNKLVFSTASDGLRAPLRSASLRSPSEERRISSFTVPPSSAHRSSIVPPPSWSKSHSEPAKNLSPISNAPSLVNNVAVSRVLAQSTNNLAFSTASDNLRDLLRSTNRSASILLANPGLGILPVRPAADHGVGVLPTPLASNSLRVGSSVSTLKLSDPAPSPPTPEELLCSLNVADFELAKVLQALSDQTKTNVMLLSDAGSKITVHLTNVRLIDMIRHICAIEGLSYLKVQNTYVIASAEKLKSGYPKEWREVNPEVIAIPQEQPVLITRTYTCSYVDSAQIADLLKKMFESEKLVVLAGPAQKNPNLASQDASQTTGTTANVMQKDQSETKVSKVLILRGTAIAVQGALEMARQMDVARPQVSIAVSIYDISNDAAKELGLSWNFGDVSITETNPRGVNLGSFNRAPQSFTAAISALEKINKAKLMASPNISVLDNERGFVLIGERINYPVLVGYSSNNSPIFDKQTERVGIYLQVAASISEENKITLSLYPQVSTITGFLNVNGASYPQVSTREAQTTLRVNTGETIVMAGLFKDEEIKQIERVPILSQIPFLGELFKRRKNSKTSSQVIISITPKVIQAKGK